MLKTMYGDYNVEYEEALGQWVGALGDLRIARAPQLCELKLLLDKHKSREKKFQRVAVSKHTSYDGWVTGVVTSIGDDGRPYVTWDKPDRMGRKREHVWSGTVLYPENAENTIKRTAVAELDHKIRELEAERESLLDAMEIYAPQRKDA